MQRRVRGHMDTSTAHAAGACSANQSSIGGGGSEAKEEDEYRHLQQGCEASAPSSGPQKRGRSSSTEGG